MPISLTNPVKYLRGVGPQRAATARRTRHRHRRRSARLSSLPLRRPPPLHPHRRNHPRPSANNFRRSHWRWRRHHGPLPTQPPLDFSRHGARCLRHASTSAFSTAAISKDRLKDGQNLVLHGKVDDDRYRPGRLEMVNPQIELGRRHDEGGAADSTEVGRIVPIYEAIGAISSRMLRRIIYSVLEQFRRQYSRTRCRRKFSNAIAFPRAAKRCSTRTSRRRTKASSCSTIFAAPRKCA